MRFATTLVLTLAGALSMAQMDPSKELFFTETKAIALLPPHVVGTGIADRAYWSPNGKYLLVHSIEVKAMGDMILDLVTNPRAEPKVIPDAVISVYDTTKQASKIVWKGKADAGMMEDASWLPNSANVILTMRTMAKDANGKQTGEDRQVLWNLSATSGQISTMFQPEEGEYVDFVTDPKAKGGVLVLRKFPKQGSTEGISARYVWLSPSGVMGSSISTKGNFAYGQVGFYQRGTRPMVIARERAGEQGLKAIWLDMDFANGTLKEVAPIDIRGDVEPEPEFRLIKGGTMSASESRAGADTKVVNLEGAWLIAKAKSQHQSALVAAEVDQMALSPANNAVFYTTKGVPMVRGLVSMPKELAMKALEAAEKAKVISDAKQVATALHIYAADYDDNLPTNNGDWMEALYPYTKNRQMMDGFVYTFGGGSLTDIKDPSTTELGYKEGPGGRAVAYADGHVKWIPNP